MTFLDDAAAIHAALPADELVGKSILFKWPVVGWVVGVLKERNCDARSYRKVRSRGNKIT